LKVRILGQLEKRPVGYEYQLFDRYDTKLGSSAMARTTGFTCCAISNLLLDGTINQYGIIAPEQIAFIPGTFTRIMNTLEHHGIQVKMNQLY